MCVRPGEPVGVRLSKRAGWPRVSDDALLPYDRFSAAVTEQDLGISTRVRNGSARRPARPVPPWPGNE